MCIVSVTKGPRANKGQKVLRLIYDALYYTALNFTALCYTELYNTALYYTILLCCMVTLSTERERERERFILHSDGTYTTHTQGCSLKFTGTQHATMIKLNFLIYECSLFVKYFFSFSFIFVFPF